MDNSSIRYNCTVLILSGSSQTDSGVIRIHLNVQITVDCLCHLQKEQVQKDFLCDLCLCITAVCIPSGKIITFLHP